MARDATDRAIDQQRAVELAGDVGAILDVEPVHLLAGRAGLLGDQRRAQHLADESHHLIHRAGEANAALVTGGGFLEPTFATTAGMNLAFHDPEGTGERPGGRFRLFGGKDGYASGYRRTEPLEQGLGLVFVDVHPEVLG